MVEVYDQPNQMYSKNKQIRFKTSMLRSDLCNYSDAQIVVEKLSLLEEQIIETEKIGL